MKQSIILFLIVIFLFVMGCKTIGKKQLSQKEIDQKNAEVIAKEFAEREVARWDDKYPYKGIRIAPNGKTKCLVKMSKDGEGEIERVYWEDLMPPEGYEFKKKKDSETYVAVMTMEKNIGLKIKGQKFYPIFEWNYPDPTIAYIFIVPNKLLPINPTNRYELFDIKNIEKIKT